LIVPAPGFDRRFYPRTAPSSLTHIIIGPELSGELINLGENGFRLAAPFELSNNFVCRATLPLNGLERPIEVCVRVVWTGDGRQAGIQFMDLSEKDRVQIREWAALQEKPAAPTESTEILNDTGTEAEAMPAAVPIRTAAVAAHPPKRKNRIGNATAVGAACVVALTAIGFALWASPLGSWLTKSLEAGTKDVFAMSKSRNAESASASTPLPQTNVTESAMGADSVTAENEAMQRADAKTTDISQASGIVSQKGTTLTEVTARKGKNHLAQKKAMPNETPAASAASSGGLDASSAARVVSGDADGDAKSRSGEESIDGKPHTGLTGGNAARPMGASDTAPSASGASAADRPTRPTDPVAAIPEASALDPEVVQTPGPTTRVVDVMLPNSPQPTVVSVPGERVFQSSALTLRIQRGIVAPAGYARWSAERKKKVMLGDLLARVDPRAPKMADAAGSCVSVRAALGKDGRVEKLTPVTGPAELVPRAMRAVREWRFQPTLLDGKPLETTALVTIEFRGHAPAPPAR
jgi:hypothetical protein